MKLAEERRIDPAVLRAIIQGDLAAMPAEVSLAYRFAEASLVHDPAADELREEICQLWGDQGVVTLVLAILSGGVYPTVKYALGFGQSCQRVTARGRAIAPRGHRSLQEVG